MTEGPPGGRSVSMSEPVRNPLHIAILASGLGAGGTEHVIAQLCHHWSSEADKVDVITFDRPIDPIFHNFPETVEMYRTNVSSGYLGTARRIVTLRRILKARKPDVLISFLTKNNLIAALATTGVRVSLICSERNNPERQGAHPLWNKLAKLLYRRADAIVCQTPNVQRCFSSSVQKKLVTIANPVPAPDVYRVQGEQRRICAVGRLTEQKGFDILIRAFGQVVQHFPSWHLDIWGEGADRSKLQSQINDLRLETHINLRGISPYPRSWVAEADIFVLSSRYEGLPNVLCEAMAAGLPVVATDCDFGPSSLVDNGRTGVLVECENSDALSAAILHLIVDTSFRNRIGNEAAQAMKHFQPSIIFRQWDELLSSLSSR